MSSVPDFPFIRELVPFWNILSVVQIQEFLTFWYHYSVVVLCVRMYVRTYVCLYMYVGVDE